MKGTRIICAGLLQAMLVNACAAAETATDSLGYLLRTPENADVVLPVQKSAMEARRARAKNTLAAASKTDALPAPPAAAAKGGVKPKTLIADDVLPPISDPVIDPNKYKPTQADVDAREHIEEVEAESKASTGAIFISPEKIYVQQPLLQALITLNKDLSPYGLESETTRPISLKDVVSLAISNSLDIKISKEQTNAKKWLWISSLGNFLPQLQNELTYQGLSGQYVSPAGLALPIKNGYLSTNSAYSWTLFKGGSILFGAAQAGHDFRAAQWGLKGTINDVLLQGAKLYYNLVLNDVLLQIRVKAVEVSKALLIVNQDLFDNGVNTQLDVLQAKYELSRDRQQLIQQQVTRREAAIKLATALYLNPSADMILSKRLVPKIRLVDDALKINDLVRIAIENRPELKRYTQLRLAALDKVKVARAPLLPQVTTTGAVVGTAAKIFQSTGSSSSSSSSNQATSLSTSGGASVGAVSGGGSLPLANSSSSSQQTKVQAGRSLFVIGLDVQWTLGGLGLVAEGQARAAQADARRVQLEFNKSMADIYQQVRDAYLNSISAEKLIEETSDAVNFGDEKLRVAQLRFQEGVGTYLDVVYAQRDYINALVDKAKAICQFNTAQADLLYALGRITSETLTTKVPIRS